MRASPLSQSPSQPSPSHEDATPLFLIPKWHYPFSSNSYQSAKGDEPGNYF